MFFDPLKIVLASHNKGKIGEFRLLFSPYPVEIVPQDEFGIACVEEPFSSFLENALHKARHASRLSGEPAIADDSGICAKALGNLPGVLSARFAGESRSAKDNNQALNQLLANESDKSVFYYCCLVFITSPQDPTPLIAEGRWEGQWITDPRGTEGFGYDPHFYLVEHGKTVAQLTTKEKNCQSHRAKAMRSLIEKLGFSSS
ncbi:MAG: RdgB/HAM1 family non-canonical purine NTP pyrophosphatase [Neisseriaceae bacterium]